MKSIYVLLLLICSLSKLVFSAPLKPLLGGDSSGGGRGVFCTSTQNPHHGRLLDIYESYALWQLHPMNPYLNYEDASRLRRKEHQRPLKNERQMRRYRVQQEKTFVILPKEIEKLYSSPCCNCGSNENQSVDHVIPLSRGGTHSIGNLMTLCRSCNSSKHARTLMEWRKAKSLVAA